MHGNLILLILALHIFSVPSPLLLDIAFPDERLRSMFTRGDGDIGQTLRVMHVSVLRLFTLFTTSCLLHHKYYLSCKDMKEIVILHDLVCNRR